MNPSNGEDLKISLFSGENYQKLLKDSAKVGGKKFEEKN